MIGFDCRSARGRRNTMATTLLAALVCAAAPRVSAQTPPPAQPGQPPAQPASPTAPAAQPPAAQPNPFTFNSDAAMLTFFIKPDKAADFEKVMAKLHDALANSDKPERKQQAAGWKLYKASEAGPNGTVLYINFLSPALKGSDYTISKILAEVFPQEVQQLFPLYRDAFAGLSRAELSLIQDFSAPPKPAASASQAPSAPPAQ
jgi:hypothetical protein